MFALQTIINGKWTTVAIYTSADAAIAAKYKKLFFKAYRVVEVK